MINFSINDKAVKGRDGWTILDVAREAGIDIPTLCNHGALEPYGACRLCTVEIDEAGRRRMVASCIYPISEGLKVYTNNDRVKNVQRWIFQLLADKHPGSEKIKELAKAYGVKESRFKSNDMEDVCILCGLCVRACEQVAGVRVLGFANRGVRNKVSTSFHLPSAECVGCGSCLYVCPTESMGRIFARLRLNPEPRIEGTDAERRLP
jgi:bidirectional [NiFe] hydrogenase diaphorase subunit